MFAETAIVASMQLFAKPVVVFRIVDSVRHSFSRGSALVRQLFEKWRFCESHAVVMLLLLLYNNFWIMQARVRGYPHTA